MRHCSSCQPVRASGLDAQCFAEAYFIGWGTLIQAGNNWAWRFSVSLDRNTSLRR